MWWSRRPFLERLTEAARLGFPAIEFWPWEGKDIRAIAETCQKLKLEVAQFTAWGFRPGLNETKNHNQFVEKVEAGCKVAQQLNCRMMCVVAGDDVRGLTQQQMHENVITGLRRGPPSPRSISKHADPRADEHPRRSQGPLPARQRADSAHHQGSQLAAS